MISFPYINDIIQCRSKLILVYDNENGMIISWFIQLLILDYPMDYIGINGSMGYSMDYSNVDHGSSWIIQPLNIGISHGIPISNGFTLKSFPLIGKISFENHLRKMIYFHDG
jgi:hypothetical protein